MTLEQRSEAVWIGRRDRWGRAGATIGLWFALFLTLPFLFVEPAEALREKHPPAGAVVYSITVAAAVIWTSYRSWRRGVRLDEHGVTVWNYWRNHRLTWAAVSSFTDGSTDGDTWALTVMRRDGRGVTAEATAARPGRPEILTVLSQAAALHGVPAKLTGVAAERPRAWLDAGSEARRQLARFAVRTAVAVIGVACAMPLLWWGSSHGGDYYPASIAGGLAAIGLIGALVAWRRREQLLEQRPMAAQDRCGEGGWFAVPLPQGAGFAPGLIARTELRRGGIVLCYFFGPSGTAVPALDQLCELRAADAVLVQKVGGLDRKWPLLGRGDGWDRSAWPVPAFGSTVKKTGESFKVIYDADLRFIRQQVADREELDGLPSNELLQAADVASVLAGLLRAPSFVIQLRGYDTRQVDLYLARLAADPGHPAPVFARALRGYDRAQVDEHLARKAGRSS